MRSFQLLGFVAGMIEIAASGSTTTITRYASSKLESDENIPLLILFFAALLSLKTAHLLNKVYVSMTEQRLWTHTDDWDRRIQP